MPEPITRVFFDARTIRSGMTGVGHYGLELLRALAARSLFDQGGGGEDLALRAAILPESLDKVRADPLLKPVEWVALNLDYESHPRGDFGLRFRVPRLVRPGEVYHGPAFSIPGGAQPFPRVVSIHDLGVFVHPRDYPRRFGAFLRWTIRRSVAVADRVIVPASAIASELGRILHVPRERISVIADAPASPSGSPVAAETPLLPGGRSLDGPFFISMGTLEPRKGADTALGALEIIRAENSGSPGPEWVWIGGAGYRAGAIMGKIRSSPVSGSFHLPGYLEREEAEAWLRRATALVYPSRYEGFGMPPLEAMAAGTPVVVADVAAVRETCADAALYFSPGDFEQLASILKRLLHEPNLRDELRNKGRERVAKFSWKATAEATLEVYRAVSVRDV